MNRGIRLDLQAATEVVAMAITWRDIIIISDAADLDDVEEEEGTPDDDDS